MNIKIIFKQNKYQITTSSRYFLVFLGVLLCCSCSSAVNFTKLMDQYHGEPKILLRAQRALKDMQLKNPESPSIDIGYGRIALSLGHINYSQYARPGAQDAISFSMDALQKDPYLFDAYLYGAYGFLYMKNFKEAESFAKKAKAINSKTPLLTILYAEMALQDKDYEESIKLAQQIIDNETDENLIVKAHLILLRGYTAMKKPDLAYLSFDKMIVLRPKSPWILMECSEFLKTQYEYDKAVTYAEKSLAINDKVRAEVIEYISDLYSIQAIDIYNHTNDMPRSIAALNNAVKHNPQNIKAHLNLGFKYYDLWKRTKDNKYLNDAKYHTVKMLQIDSSRPDGKWLLEEINNQLNKN